MGPVGEKHTRMRWLWALCLSLALFTAVTAKPAVQETHADLDQESEFIAELLTNLLVPAERQGRQVADEEDEEEIVEVAEVEATEVEANEVEGEALEDSEALKEAEKVEISRFNNYIDAIYRRMNAALKAKLMDPMELNLDEKPKKNELKKAKSEKTRVLREALDEDDVDRMGKPAKTEKKERKTKEERLADKKKRKERKKKKNDAKENKKEMKEKKKEGKEKKKEMKEKRMEMKAQKSKESKEKKMEAKRKRKNKVERESRSNRKNKNKKKNKQVNNKPQKHNKRGKDSMKNAEKKARKG